MRVHLFLLLFSWSIQACIARSGGKCKLNILKEDAFTSWGYNVNCTYTGATKPPHFKEYAKNIKTLDLSHNQIRILEKDLFEGLTRLVNLDLHGNENLKVLGKDVFTNLEGLAVLQLHNTGLSSLDKNAIVNNIPILQVLSFGGNKNLLCDCSISWLWKDYMGIEQFLPRNLSGFHHRKNVLSPSFLNVGNLPKEFPPLVCRDPESSHLRKFEEVDLRHCRSSEPEWKEWENEWETEDVETYAAQRNTDLDSPERASRIRRNVPTKEHPTIASKNVEFVCLFLTFGVVLLTMFVFAIVVIVKRRRNYMQMQMIREDYLQFTSSFDIIDDRLSEIKIFSDKLGPNLLYNFNDVQNASKNNTKQIIENDYMAIADIMMPPVPPPRTIHMMESKHTNFKKDTIKSSVEDVCKNFDQISEGEYVAIKDINLPNFEKKNEEKVEIEQVVGNSNFDQISEGEYAEVKDSIMPNLEKEINRDTRTEEIVASPLTYENIEEESDSVYEETGSERHTDNTESDSDTLTDGSVSEEFVKSGSQLELITDDYDIGTDYDQGVDKDVVIDSGDGDSLMSEGKYSEEDVSEYGPTYEDEEDVVNGDSEADSLMLSQDVESEEDMSDLSVCESSALVTEDYSGDMEENLNETESYKETIGDVDEDASEVSDCDSNTLETEEEYYREEEDVEDVSEASDCESNTLETEEYYSEEEEVEDGVNDDSKADSLMLRESEDLEEDVGDVSDTGSNTFSEKDSYSEEEVVEDVSDTDLNTLGQEGSYSEEEEVDVGDVSDTDSNSLVNEDSYNEEEVVEDVSDVSECNSNILEKEESYNEEEVVAEDSHALDNADLNIEKKDTVKEDVSDADSNTLSQEDSYSEEEEDVSECDSNTLEKEESYNEEEVAEEDVSDVSECDSNTLEKEESYNEEEVAEEDVSDVSECNSNTLEKEESYNEEEVVEKDSHALNDADSNIEDKDNVEEDPHALNDVDSNIEKKDNVEEDVSDIESNTLSMEDSYSEEEGDANALDDAVSNIEIEDNVEELQGEYTAAMDVHHLSADNQKNIVSINATRNASEDISVDSKDRMRFNLTEIKVHAKEIGNELASLKNELFKRIETMQSPKSNMKDDLTLPLETQTPSPDGNAVSEAATVEDVNSSEEILRANEAKTTILKTDVSSLVIGTEKVYLEEGSAPIAETKTTVLKTDVSSLVIGTEKVYVEEGATPLANVETQTSAGHFAIIEKQNREEVFVDRGIAPAVEVQTQTSVGLFEFPVQLPKEEVYAGCGTAPVDASGDETVLEKRKPKTPLGKFLQRKRKPPLGLNVSAEKINSGLLRKTLDRLRKTEVAQIKTQEPLVQRMRSFDSAMRFFNATENRSVNDLSTRSSEKNESVESPSEFKAVYTTNTTDTVSYDVSSISSSVGSIDSMSKDTDGGEHVSDAPRKKKKRFFFRKSAKSKSKLKSVDSKSKNGTSKESSVVDHTNVSKDGKTEPEPTKAPLAAGANFQYVGSINEAQGSKTRSNPSLIADQETFKASLLVSTDDVEVNKLVIQGRVIVDNPTVKTAPETSELPLAEGADIQQGYSSKKSTNRRGSDVVVGSPINCDPQVPRTPVAEGASFYHSRNNNPSNIRDGVKPAGVDGVMIKPTKLQRGITKNADIRHGCAEENADIHHVGTMQNVDLESGPSTTNSSVDVGSRKFSSKLRFFNGAKPAGVDGVMIKPTKLQRGITKNAGIPHGRAEENADIHHGSTMKNVDLESGPSTANSSLDVGSRKFSSRLRFFKIFEKKSRQ